MTPEEQMAEKLRLRKLQEESDFEMARETFGLTEAPSSDSFESQNPSTKEEFDEFKKLVVDKLQSLEKSALYMPFLEDFMRDLCVNFEAEEVKKLSSVLNALANEKVKSQKGKAKKKAGGKKATLKLDRGNNYMEDYGGDDFEDFI
ncbi:EIF3J [Cordylochernes scorpioides]|uniref:EIF3J n=2 Tax=Cordylochernes scorpioides TaxID=51811 RepID=A0ABY6KER0_9ARAC|nr:EIF3J [Cordylochernes scorpioides]